jgi:hypothetical protein
LKGEARDEFRRGLNFAHGGDDRNAVRDFRHKGPAGSTLGRMQLDGRALSVAERAVDVVGEDAFKFRALHFS